MIFDYFNQKAINLIDHYNPERDAGAKPHPALETKLIRNKAWSEPDTPTLGSPWTLA